jgi:hypothetical protein
MKMLGEMCFRGALILGLVSSGWMLAHGQTLGEDEYQCNEIPLPELTQVPPLTTTMPLEVLYTYIVVDSLSRTRWNLNTASEFAKVNLGADQIKELNRYIFSATNYDPILFLNVLYRGKTINNDYVKDCMALLGIYEEAAIAVNGGRGVNNYLALSSGIFEIEVMKIEESYKPPILNPTWGQMNSEVCMHAKVTEIIKGGSLVNSCVDANGSPYMCINVTYRNYWPTIVRGLNNNSNRVTMLDADSIGVDSTGNTVWEKSLSPENEWYGFAHAPQQGDRYFIVVAADISGDGEVDYANHFQLNPFRGYSYDGGLFKINDNIIHDRGNFFGQGEYIIKNDFYNWLQSYIESNF